jgi:hypothetical protein
MLADRACDLLGIFKPSAYQRMLRRVIMLGFDKGAADLDCIQLVTADRR